MRHFICCIVDVDAGYKLATATKASFHEGQCIPAGYCHAHMLIYESADNYNVNSKYTKYFAQRSCRNFAFWKISAANLRIL